MAAAPDLQDLSDLLAGTPYRAAARIAGGGDGRGRGGRARAVGPALRRQNYGKGRARSAVWDRYVRTSGTPRLTTAIVSQSATVVSNTTYSAVAFPRCRLRLRQQPHLNGANGNHAIRNMQSNHQRLMKLVMPQNRQGEPLRFRISTGSRAVMTRAFGTSWPRRLLAHAFSDACPKRLDPRRDNGVRVRAA
jgi:hypothetical protein